MTRGLRREVRALAALTLALGCGDDGGAGEPAPPDVEDTGRDGGPRLDEGTSPSDAGELLCDLEECPAYDLSVPLSLPSCCLPGGGDAAGDDGCGVSFSAWIDVFPLDPVIVSCVRPEPERPFRRDGCPDRTLAPFEFPGCCRNDGVCGYVVDLTNVGGPRLGCVPNTMFSDETVILCG
jgi:hypothetical protein